jgi:ADP-heptose:LPS heptosyltransferase
MFSALALLENSIPEANISNGVITIDTGPVHIAAAIDTPILAIIGPTDFRRAGPYKTNRNKISILSANLPCSPCYHA